MAATLMMLAGVADLFQISATPPEKKQVAKRNSAPLTICRVGIPTKENPNKADSGYHIEFHAYMPWRFPNPGTTPYSSSHFIVCTWYNPESTDFGWAAPSISTIAPTSANKRMPTGCAVRTAYK